MLLTLLIAVVSIETALSLEFGRLYINGQTENDLELKSYIANRVLTISFRNANITDGQKNDTSKTAKVIFSRDPTAEHTYATVTEVANDQNLSHYTIDWFNPLATEEFCFNIAGDQHWYSTYEEQWQRWPMDKTFYLAKEWQEFTTHDQYQYPIGGILESLFLGSQGFAVYLDKSSPLFFKRDPNSDNPLICFGADYSKIPYNHALDKSVTKITAHLMTGADILSVWKYWANRFIKKPTGIPDERMFKSPVWSTWVKYKDPVDQEKVLQWAKEITSHGLPNSQLEIDETWEPKFGDWEFDTKKFPNPQEMVSELNKMGFRTTVWLTPFVNQDSAVFNSSSQYLIKSQNGTVLTENWWNGKGAFVDFTSKEAQDWYVSRLNHLKNTTGLDSFKFDAGELNYVNKDFYFSDKTYLQTPSEITRLYVETLSRLGSMVETRVAYNSQHVPVFVRMLDKFSIWDYNDGVATMIPTALMMSIAGYPFVLPDMIGGNAYGNFPSKELYIRWLQINTFMPSLQFSISPWDFGDSSDEVLNVTKAMLKLHEQYTPLMIQLAQNAVKTGEPIMRPLWWVAPNDTNTFTVDDQFLVGNDLLVAPVTKENARKRDIYLPEGQWKDEKGTTHKGPTKLTDYPADLHELPYFTRL